MKLAFSLDKELCVLQSAENSPEALKIQPCASEMKGKTMALDCKKNMCFIGFLYLPVLYLRLYLFQMKESQGESQGEYARPQLVCRL